MKNLKIKIITGFRENQFYTVNAHEAHKAYYLFLNPEERGVFENGVALVGKNIQGIEPDYHSMMGWNPTHQLDSDDWNEINKSDIAKKMREIMIKGKTVAGLFQNKPYNPKIFTKRLDEIEFDDFGFKQLN